MHLDQELLPAAPEAQSFSWLVQHVEAHGLRVVRAHRRQVCGEEFDGTLWDWVLAISPFWHVPTVTNSSAIWSGLSWITLVTVLFVFLGFAGFRQRDLAS